MTEVAGNTLVDGRYRILRRIGSGGMADVYCAEDSHLGRQVAIKVLHRRFAQDQEFVERFRREAKSAAGLNHPNVVGVFDRGEHEGTYYIAMEYLTGPHAQGHRDLARRPAPGARDRHRHADPRGGGLRAPPRRDPPGLQAAQRDRRRRSATPRSRTSASRAPGASEMTETGSIMGTAQYLSPEQAQGHAVTAHPTSTRSA